MRYSKKNFYSDYYQHHYFRDGISRNFYRNIVTSELKKIYRKGADINPSRFHYFILNNINNQDLMISCSYFNKVNDLWEYQDNLRYVDRLFFDFDYHDETSDEIGVLRKECIKNNNYKGFIQTQKQLKNYVLNSDLLEKPLSEALKVIDYWKGKGIEPLLFFSGSSGFHLNILFEGANLSNINLIAKDYYNTLTNKFDLETSDSAVTDLLKRKQRVPYSINQKSGLQHCLVEGRDLDSILQEIRKPKVVDLSDINIAPSGFTKHLIKWNEKKETISKLQKEKVQKKKEIQKRRFSKYNKNVNDDDLFGNMRTLCKFIASDYLHKENPDKDYDIYECMFHEDNNPSARVYSSNFYCASEGLHLRYFEFIRKFYKLNSDDEVKKKMKELKIEFNKNN